MKLLISEILQKVSNAKTKAEKVQLLRQHNSQTLRSLLIWNFDDSVISEIPDGEVPYTPNTSPKGTEHTLLEHEGRKLYYFVKGGSNIPALKKESMFIAMCEGLHAEEAEVLCLVKDKDLQSKFRITKACVEEAFPQIQWGGRT